MSTNLEYRERESRRQASEAQKEKKKKNDRELERERENKGDIFFCWKNNMKFCTGGERIRNASGHQGENERN